MSIGMKIAAAAGALALIALVPTPAQAQETTGAFTIEANRDVYNVTCRVDSSFGTAPIRLRVTNDATTATRWVATWLGGSGGTITMTAEGQFFSARPGATFPCPELASTSGLITLTVTAFNAANEEIGSRPIKIRVRRVGSPSGPSAVVNGVALVTEVLGLRLGDPNGPTPVGGIRTGAGGTSPGSNNVLLPLGAGLGFAGLASAAVIRRRRGLAV